jgi:uncharacterized protein
MKKTEPARKSKGVEVRVLAEPKVRSPVLVCGMPGSGYVGKLGADHIVSAFKAKKVAEMRCDSFPPQVMVDESGIAEPLRAEMFLAKTKRGGDVMVFTADAQPATSEGEYELADAVVDLAMKNGVKTVYTLAAYITGAFSKSPRVFGSATSRGMLDRLAQNGVTLMKEGAISGMNGLLIGVAALRGMEGACLLGETSGYVIDAAASEAVLQSLSKIMKVKIDTAKLKEKAEETQKVISQLQSLSDQSRGPPPQQPSQTRPGYIG